MGGCCLPIMLPSLLDQHRFFQRKPQSPRIFQVKMGQLLSYFTFLVLSFFLTRVDAFSLIVAFILYVFFFLVYVFCHYNGVFKDMLNACRSSWSMFLYMVITIVFGYLNQHDMFKNWPILCGFILAVMISFRLLINQKDYNPCVK